MFVDESMFTVIEVDLGDLKQQSESHISSIASEVEYIPLETRNDCLIGEIERLFVVDGSYCIVDGLTESILIFNSDGKFSHKIARKGRAPEEYARMFYATVDQTTKDIYIYSDMDQAIFRYSWQGKFIEKTAMPLIISSFEAEDGNLLLYAGRSWNKNFYSSSFPRQWRYALLRDNEIVLNQLEWEYKEEFGSIPLPRYNFTRYRDTVLLTEFIDSKVYSTDSDKSLVPRYRIDFLSNEYDLSWDKPFDIEQWQKDLSSGRQVELSNMFHENSNCIMFNYAHEIIGLVYVDKTKNSIHNMGYFILDDYNKIPMSSVISYLDENCMYQIKEPLSFTERNVSMMTPAMQKKFGNLKISDNPILVKVKLK
jgi:hypothetical protein